MSMRSLFWHGLGITAIVTSVSVESPAGVVVPSRPALQGSVLLVDADAHAEVPPDECAGDGSEASPFRSLECAFASGSIRAGTTVQLLDAATPYAGGSSVGHALPSGTLDAPVVIEPAPGHAPIVVGPLELRALEHWTVRGLVFDGSGGDTPSSDAIRIEGSNLGPVEGVTIEGVTIVGWPGRGIVVRGNASSWVQSAEIRDNRIEGAQGAGLWLEDAPGTMVVGNEVAAIGCTTSSFTLCDECGAGRCAPCGDCLGEPLESCGATSEHSLGGQSGVRVLGDSSGVLVWGNHFHDFHDDDCGTDATRTAAVFITGAGASNGDIRTNLVERIAPGNPDNGYGILLFQSATGWHVERNVLSQIGRCALCEGDALFYGSRDSVWAQNTVVDVAGTAIDIRWAANVQLRGNLVANAAGVRVWPEGVDEAPDLHHNLYWSGQDDGMVGRWGDDTVLDLGAWQAACGCDASSLVGDPGLPQAVEGLDVTPSALGPAIDNSDSPEEPHNGNARDIGALEPPQALEARVIADRPTAIRVELDSQFASPLQGLDGCVGFTVLVNDQLHLPTACAKRADAAVELELDMPVPPGEAAQVHYDLGGITDSAAIGGILAARLPAFVLHTNPLPFPGGDETTGGSSPGDTTWSDEGGSNDGGMYDTPICGCRQGPSGPQALGWAMLLLGLASRPRSRPRLRRSGRSR